MTEENAIVVSEPSKMVAKTTALVNFILDRSGSMESVLEETIHGFNKYVEELRDHREVDYLLSLTLFGGNEIDRRHVSTRLAKVGPLTRDNYHPAGFTPLYDAIGVTVREVEKDARPVEKVLTVIMTDGHENSSHEYTKADIVALIKRKEAEGNWSFVFLGATLDAMDIGAGMGIPVGNTAAYNSANTTTVFASNARATRAWSGSSQASVKNFYSDEDKEEFKK